MIGMLKNFPSSLKTLDSQHVKEPTHNKGHILNQVISKGQNISNDLVLDAALSDNFCVLFDMTFILDINTRSEIVKKQYITILILISQMSCMKLHHLESESLLVSKRHRGGNTHRPNCQECVEKQSVNARKLNSKFTMISTKSLHKYYLELKNARQSFLSQIINL